MLDVLVPLVDVVVVLVHLVVLAPGSLLVLGLVTSAAQLAWVVSSAGLAGAVVNLRVRFRTTTTSTLPQVTHDVTQRPPLLRAGCFPLFLALTAF